MFAVFEDGSRQYKVSPGTRVKVDHRKVERGDRVEFGRVLLYGDGDDLQIGQPALDGMRVVGTVVDQPSTKYVIQYFRRRKNSRRRTGHRQRFVMVEVEHILLPGQDAPPPEEKSEPQQEEKTEQPEAAATSPTETSTSSPEPTSDAGTAATGETASNESATSEDTTESDEKN